MTDPLAVVRALRHPPGADPAPPRAAATVVLVRAGQGGPEVLLTERPSTMAFAAGIHVFPGGRVDPADARPDHVLADGLAAAEAARRLAGQLAPDAALAHFVAAARETWEETGIRVAARDLIALSRWVTPRALARRFDVWFFAVPVPAGTEAGPGSEEVETAEWIAPAAALEASRHGTMALLQPTIVTLEQMAGLADAEAIRAAFAPGLHLDPPSVGTPREGVAVVDQRWAGGIAGRRANGWLVGQRELVLVDPADPTAITAGAIEAAVAARGGRLVGIALTGLLPEQHAGVELYAAGDGLPVVSGPGASGRVPYPVLELRPGEAVPFGDVTMAAASGGRLGPGVTDYLLPGGRRLP